MIEKINKFCIWAESNLKSILILCSIVMIAFITIVLFSWLFGYFANGLYSYKFDLQSCWGGLTAVITGIGSILTIAGVNLVHKYIDSKYNSELGQMPKDAGGENKC